MKKLHPLDLVHILFFDACFIAYIIFRVVKLELELNILSLIALICLFAWYNVTSVVKLSKYEGSFMSMMKNKKWKIFNIIFWGTLLLGLFWSLKEIYG